MIATGSSDFWKGNLALCLGSFMTFANLWMPQPLLPTMATEFGLSTLGVSASMSIATFTLGLSLLVYGPLSDALGRRRIMLITLSAVTLITLLLSLATDFSQLLLLRALQGLFLGGLPAIAIAYLGDEYRNDAMVIAVGLYISGNTLGGIGGRLIGGMAGETLGIHWTFALMGGISLCCLLGFFWLLPKPQHFRSRPLHPATMAGDLLRHMRHPVIFTCCLISGLNFMIFINLYSYVTFLLEATPYALPASLIGLLFLTYLSGTFGSAISGRLAQRFGQRGCMSAGTLIMIAGTLTTLQLSVAAIVVGLLINSFGFFLAHSSASALVNRSASQAKASASALYLIFYYTGASIGGLYLDPFWQAAGWEGVTIASVVILGTVFMATLFLGVAIDRCSARATDQSASPG